jgi:uncharacterized protein (TIGR02246 family)
MRTARFRFRTIGVAMSLLALPACIILPSSTTKSVPRELSRSAIDSARAEILAMMENSARAWNRGDVDAFVSDYDPAMTTTFVGSKGVLRGAAAIRSSYAPRFAPGGVRDSLSFENVEVDILSSYAAHVLAYYRLTRGGMTTARGPTSLVMRKEQGRWRIVHDHSS